MLRARGNELTRLRVAHGVHARAEALLRLEQLRVVGDDALLHHLPRRFDLLGVHEVVHDEGLEAHLALARGAQDGAKATGAAQDARHETDERGGGLAGGSGSRA